MSCDWQYQSKSRAQMDFKRPSTDTVQSDDLTAIERFVREIIANSRDSKLDNADSVSVIFHFMELKGEEKSIFLDKIQFSSLVDAYTCSITMNSNAIDEQFLGINPVDIEDSDLPLRILTVTDSNTKGLTGPEFLNPEFIHDGRIDPICRFIGLCRTTGLNLSGDQSDTTGSWGYGKSVLWANNHTKIVFFHSILSSPWRQNSVTIDRKLYGYTMLTDFFNEDGKPVSGDIYFGLKNVGELSEPRSIWNDETDEYQQVLGNGSFNLSQSGTSIMIVGFEPDDDKQYRSDEIVIELKNAVEKFFWPAIADKMLDVQIFHDGEKIETDIRKNRNIEPFVRLYKRMRRKPDSDEVSTFDISGPQMLPFNAKISVGVRQYSEPPSDFTYMNGIAKIRGNKMVTQYEEVKLPGLSTKGAIGIALAGEILTDSNSFDQKQQKKLDRLLLMSEPISHHKWDDKNRKLKKYKAGYTIQKINKLIRNEFKNLAIHKGIDIESEYSTYSLGYSHLVDVRALERGVVILLIDM